MAAAINSMNEALLAQGEKLSEITDQQFKLINECVIAALHTTEDAKLEYLLAALANAARVNLQDVEATILGRVVRDISAEELRFLMTAFRYDGIAIAGQGLDFKPNNILTVEPRSRDALIVNGLTGLGLLQVGGGTFDDMGVITFTPIVAKLIAVMQRTRNDDA